MTNRGPLVLLTGSQTPDALRRTGRERLLTWLRDRNVRGAQALADAATAAAAAERQHATLPGEMIAAQMVHDLAQEVMSLNQQITELDKLIEARFREHELAAVIESMPGIGPLLGAEFLAAIDGDLSRFGTPDRLASLAGVASVPRDSGNARGNPHRPNRYHRQSVAHSTPRPSSASASAPSPGASMIVRAPRASITSRPSSPWPGDALTSSGH